MRFWDTSALIPLVVREATTDAVIREFRLDPSTVVWWAAEVECTSALARLRRTGSLDSPSMAEAVERLAMLVGNWTEVEPGPRVRRIATRLVRVHPLRAADALQLAAALVAADDQPGTLPIVTFDDRLAEAAEREGFAVVQPLA